MSWATGRRKAAGIPFPFHLVMMITAASETVFGRPCHGAAHLCYPGADAIDNMNTDSEKLYNQYYEEFRNVYHQISKRRAKPLDLENTKKGHVDTDETDIVDREDHVTQYLSELLVNTDSEITSLEGSDVETPDESSSAREAQDRYFLYLTEEEGVQEIDNVLSLPAHTIIRESEMYKRAYSY